MQSVEEKERQCLFITMKRMALGFHVPRQELEYEEKMYEAHAAQGLAI